MSLIFEWNLLSEEKNKERIKTYINELLHKIDLPEGLDMLGIREIDFGDVAPQMSIVDVQDPLPEFYFPVELIAESEKSNVGTETSSQSSLSSEEEKSIQAQGTVREDGDMMTEFLKMIKDDRDFQMEIQIEYKGNMKIVAEAALSVNNPVENFLLLPVKFIIKELIISGTITLVFIGDRINLCFKQPAEDGSSIIKNMKVEPEIGCKGKQVLKNVDKIGKYIVFSIQKLINEKLVFPNHHSFIFGEPSINSKFS